MMMGLLRIISKRHYWVHFLLYFLHFFTKDARTNTFFHLHRRPFDRTETSLFDCTDYILARIDTLVSRITSITRSVAPRPNYLASKCLLACFHRDSLDCTNDLDCIYHSLVQLDARSHQPHTSCSPSTHFLFASTHHSFVQINVLVFTKDACTNAFVHLHRRPFDRTETSLFASTRLFILTLSFAPTPHDDPIDMLVNTHGR